MFNNEIVDEIKHALSCVLQNNLWGFFYFKQLLDTEEVILQQPRFLYLTTTRTSTLFLFYHGNKIELIVYLWHHS